MPWQQAITEPYRIWYSRNGEMSYHGVETVGEGLALIDDQSRADLENELVMTNVFGLEEREDDGEWHEWYDEDGRDAYAFLVADAEAHADTDKWST